MAISPQLRALLVAGAAVAQAAEREREAAYKRNRAAALNAIQTRMMDGRPFSQDDLHQAGTAAIGDGRIAYRATISAITKAKRDGDIVLSGFGRTARWSLAPGKEGVG